MTRLEAMTKLAAMIDLLRNTADHSDVTYDPSLCVFANYGTPRDKVDQLRATLQASKPYLTPDCLRYKNEDHTITVFVSDEYCEPDLLANRDVHIVEIGGAA